ncbi:MAG: tryptophan-rich sensory protein [Bacteroidota bacterium]
MQRKTTDWLGNIIALAITIFVNYLATALPIGGQTTGQVSDTYFNLFTPAGFTFAIWGVIYLSLIVFAIYQALPAQRNDAEIAGISIYFQLSCLFNSTWIFAWHYNWIIVSMILMIGIWISLILVYKHLNIALNRGNFLRSLMLRFPFSIYTGWITVAFIANLSALQTAMGWNDLGLDEITWTWIKIAIAGAAAAIVALQRRDIAYVAVISWAAFGISRGQATHPEIVGAASMLTIFALILIIYEGYRRLRRE